MIEIRIGSTGLIVAGKETGWNVYIQDDSHNTGGYLILVSPPDAETDLTPYDNWVENYQDLEKYFQETGWKVDWQKNS